jgi:cellulose synthase/poly-beta-1,6-N-acetylglucosamine synthase-like glycosyltransferase
LAPFLYPPESLFLSYLLAPFLVHQSLSSFLIFWLLFFLSYLLAACLPFLSSGCFSCPSEFLFLPYLLAASWIRQILYSFLIFWLVPLLIIIILLPFFWPLS